MPKNLKKAEQAAEGIVNVISGVAGKLEKGSLDNPFKVKENSRVVNALTKKKRDIEKGWAKSDKEKAIEQSRIKENRRNKDLAGFGRVSSARVQLTKKLNSVQNDIQDRNQAIDKNKFLESVIKNFEGMLEKNPDVAHNINYIARKQHRKIATHFPIGYINKPGQKGESTLTMNGKPLVYVYPGFGKNEINRRKNLKVDFPAAEKFTPYQMVTPRKALTASETYAKLYLKLHNMDKNKGEMFISMFEDWDGPIWDLYQKIKNMPSMPQAKL